MLRCGVRPGRSHRRRGGATTAKRSQARAALAQTANGSCCVSSGLLFGRAPGAVCAYSQAPGSVQHAPEIRRPTTTALGRRKTRVAMEARGHETPVRHHGRTRSANRRRRSKSLARNCGAGAHFVRQIQDEAGQGQGLPSTNLRRSPRQATPARRSTGPTAPKTELGLGQAQHFGAIRQRTSPRNAHPHRSRPTQHDLRPATRSTDRRTVRSNPRA